MSEFRNINNLQNEQSAYLKQHKNDPIYWQPYSTSIVEEAKKQNKPIFLSIGYSACHWCHVMAEESFTDQKTADFLNEHFINIKIDREEFPDIDQYYQLAGQISSGQGGWPLNAFLLQDMKPFFIGTYFPKSTQGDIPSFMDVAQSVHNSFNDDFDNVQKNAETIANTIKQKPTTSEKVPFDGHFPTPASVLNAIKNFQDSENGGYGSSPKFPQFAFYEYCVDQILEGVVPDEFAKHTIESIEKMLMGGIYDHAKGGIHRYAVDEKWQIPHFEKMLYDQAGLIKLLIKTSLIYPAPVVLDALIQTLDYLETEMLSDEGYFFTSQDADSEGVEGLYFTFTKDEFLDAIVSFNEKLSDKSEQILEWFNITDKGNYKNNLNVISLNHSKKDELYTPGEWDTIREVRVALLQERKNRIPPRTDSKGVASWNFQIISALLDVIQYSKVDVISKSAFSLLTKTFEKIHETFIYAQDDKMRISPTTTSKHFSPLFEDYSMFIDAQLRFYELSGSETLKQNAKNSFEFAFDEFYKDGAFYTRSLSDNDKAPYDNIHTPIFDQSYKSALSTFILNFNKWFYILDLGTHKEKIDKTKENLTHLALQNPLAFGEALRALTYPQEAFKRILVPRKWISEEKIQKFFSNFSIRFALDYHDQDSWQVCNSQACEIDGPGYESFEKAFTPQSNDSKSE